MSSAQATPRAAALALIAAGVLCVLVATATYGPGLSPDSANYFSAAASLRAGDGLIDVAAAPLVHFPPLFPLTLAALEVAGLTPGSAAVLLNIVCLAVVLTMTVVMVLRLTASRPTAVVAGAFALFSAPHIEAFTWVLSEGLFVALLAGFVWLFSRRGQATGWTTFVGLGLLAATLPLTRYPGVVLLPATALAVLLVGRDAPVSRLTRAAMLVVVAALPLAAYLVRNELIAGRITGARNPASASVVSVLRGFVATVLHWFLPWSWILRLQSYSDAPWALALLFAAALATAGGVVWWLARWWREHPDDLPARQTLALLVLWVAGYSAFLCAAAVTIEFNPIGPRFLVPILFPTAILLATAAHTAARRSVPLRSRAARAAAVALIVALGALQVGRVVVFIGHKRADGAGGYATRRWQDSPFGAYLAANPPPAGTISNAPDELYLLTGKRYGWVPRAGQPEALARLRQAAGRGEPVTIAWFDAVDWRSYLIDRQTLIDAARLVAVRSEEDGALYAGRR